MGGVGTGEVKAIFEQVLSGEITPKEAEIALCGKSSSDNQIFRRLGKKILHYSNQVQVVLAPECVIRKLEDYLAGKVTALEIEEWAAFIKLSDAYDSPNWRYCESNPDDDEAADKYGSMWDVILDRMCPKVHGELTPEMARQYIAQLEKLLPTEVQ